MKFFRFAKPRTPGYEIRRDYYLSVLCGTPVLPSPREFAHPKSAFPAFIAPISQPEASALDEPMARGVYALASLDRKTVLELMVMPTDEAGFSPGRLAESALGKDLSAEARARLTAAWHLVQFSFRAFDPAIGPALDLLLDGAARLALLTDGVVTDPICQRVLLPEAVRLPERLRPLDAREHIVVKRVPDHAHTLGLLKFGLPELELSNVDDRDFERAASLLVSLAQFQLQGSILSPGASVEGFTVADGGLDRARWDGLPVYDLLPPRGLTTPEALARWRKA